MLQTCTLTQPRALLKVRAFYIICFMCISLSTLFYVHFTIYLVLCAFHYLPCFMCISLATLFYLNFTRYLILCEFHYLPYFMRISLSTLFHVHFTIYLIICEFHICFIERTLHSLLFQLHCTLISNLFHTVFCFRC